MDIISSMVQNRFRLIVIVLSLGILLPGLATYPQPWYDEGLNTHVARQFDDTMLYGTYTIDGANPYDPALTTGPTVLYPIALSFNLFGPGIVQSRVVIVIYSLLAIGLFHALADRLFGFPASNLATLILLTLPAIGGMGFVLIGRQVLGEMAALMFALLGMLLWSESWKGKGRLWSLVAGISFGLGVVSKFQSGIAIIPTILLLSIFRYQQRRSMEPPYFLAPAAGILIISGWLVIQALGQNPTFQLQNNLDSINAIQILLVPGFWARTLTLGGWGILSGMSLAVLPGIVRLRKAWFTHEWSEKRTLELGVVMIVIIHGLWYGILSIGWPRYAFFGWVFAILLLGGYSVIFLEQRMKRLSMAERWGHSILMYWSPFFLGAAAFLIHLPPVMDQPGNRMVYEMAAHVSDILQPEDVLESWEWQIDVLIDHRTIHHPPQSLLLEATVQRFLEWMPFDLTYDFMAEDPDYLLTGPFSDWTGIYDREVVENNFRWVVTNGPYSLWERTPDY